MTLWAAILGVCGTLAASVITQLFQIKQQKRQRTQQLEDWLREQDVKQKEKQDAIEEEAKRNEMKSDVAVCKRIKHKLDDMHWEMNKMRPGAQPSADGGGLIYVSYVSPPHKELIELANEILKISYSVKFHDQESEDLLNKLIDDFKKFIETVNMEAFYRSEVQQRSKSNLATKDVYDQAQEADKEAREMLLMIDQDYEDIKDLIRRKYGFHNIYD